MRFFFIVIGVLVGTTSGDYICYNYTGHIDKYPISLSFQLAWSDSPMVKWKIYGNYQYRTSTSALYLRGNYEKQSGKITLLEFDKNFSKSGWGELHIEDADSMAIGIFEFNFSENKCAGTWTSKKSKKVLPLTLVANAKIDESDYGNRIDILQNYSTSKRYFVGEYSLDSSGCSKVKMKRLKVYDKKTRNLLQTISFEKFDFAFGTTSTIIYNNIWHSERGFWIWTDLGRTGSEVEFVLNTKTGKYELSKADAKDLKDFMIKE